MRIVLTSSIPQRALIRAMVWATIGAIYAPLLVVLHALLIPAMGPAAYIGAAAVAGAVGAAFYGARQVALVASVIGAISALLVLVVLDGAGSFELVAALAAVAGIGTGLAVRFPSRCTAHVPAKVVTGGLTGALCGGMLAAAAGLNGPMLSLPVAVAFLVSVNGVVYVSSVPLLARLGAAVPDRFCNVVEGLVLAVIAVIVAGSVWGFSGMLLEEQRDLLIAVIDGTSAEVPMAVAAGMVAGAVTGALLELFELAWIDDI